MYQAKGPPIVEQQKGDAEDEILESILRDSNQGRIK